MVLQRSVHSKSLFLRFQNHIPASAPEIARRNFSSDSRSALSAFFISVTSSTATLMPKIWPLESLIGYHCCIQVLITPGWAGVIPLNSRPMTVLPVSASSWATATACSSRSGTISPTVLPICSSTEKPFISAKRLFIRTKRKSESNTHNPIGAEL